MTQGELKRLHETHTFEMLPQELEWLHPDAKVLFDQLEAQATKILMDAYDLAKQSERAYQREIPRARRAIEPILEQQRRLTHQYLKFPAPVILLKPKPTEPT